MKPGRSEVSVGMQLGSPSGSAKLLGELSAARAGAELSQEQAAARAGLSRMTVQRTESGAIDPRLSTLVVLARALGLELMLVPMGIRPALEDFIRSGGRALSRPVGIDAPPSVIDSLRQEPPESRR